MNKGSIKIKVEKPSDSEGDESANSVENGLKELQTKTTKKLELDLEINHKIHYLLNAHWDKLSWIEERLDVQRERFDQVECRLSQLEKVNIELKNILINVVDEISLISNLPSNEAVFEFEKKSQPDSSVTPNPEDVIDKNGYKEESLGEKSGKTLKCHGCTTNGRNGPDAIRTVIKPLEPFKSYLEIIDNECSKLTNIVEEGMIPNTKSLTDSILLPHKTDITLNDKEFKNKNVTSVSSVNNGKVQTDSNPNKKDSHREDVTVNWPLHQERNGTDTLESRKTQLSMQQCFLCNAPASFPCQICMKKNAMPKADIPLYCGEDHQNLHLTLGHDFPCGKKAFKLGWMEIRGFEGINNGLPYYVATKELEPGHVLFTKKPLFIFPKKLEFYDIVQFDLKFPTLAPFELEPCIICNEIMAFGQLVEDPLHGIRLNECPSCGWPVHSSRDVDGRKLKMSCCQEEHEKECKIFTYNDLKWDKRKENYSWLHLGALRVVLNLNEDVKRKLLNLPVFNRPSFHQDVHRFVRKDCKQDQVSEKELNKIIHVLLSNSLPSSAGYFSIRKKYTHTIYAGGHFGRILPHDCNPNCSIYVNPKTGEATFKTRRKVGPDEMLTINYLVDVFPQPIHQRALSLMKNYLIDPCECGKCKDGQDVTSAMIRMEGTKKHNKGCSCKYLMPYSNRLQTKEMDKKEYESLRSEQGTSKRLQNTLNSNRQDPTNPDPRDLYIWQCESCKSLGPSMEQSVVHQKVEILRKKLNKALFEDKNCELKEIIETYSDKELHPDHSMMLLAHVALGYIHVEHIKIFDISKHEEGRLSFHAFLPDLDKAIEMLDRIDNGRSEMYGHFVYCQSLLKMSQLGKKLSIRRNKPNVSEMKMFLESIENNLNESWEIMKDNPHLEAREIIQNLRLFELYSKELETHCKGLVEFSQESFFETFRLKQIALLRTKFSSTSTGSWYLFKVEREGNQDSSSGTETDGTESDEDVEQYIMVKTKIIERMSTFLGAFTRELMSLDE